MLKILTEVMDFLWKGVSAYASTDEGRQELNDILDAVEAEGIDIPFYSSQAGPEEPPLDLRNREGGEKDYSDFVRKHPELFRKEQQ
jgi:hypothetical protein